MVGQEVRVSFELDRGCAWQNTATAVPAFTTTTMDEPTALFDSYEHDFNQLIDDVRHNLDGEVGAGKDGKSETLCFALTTHADWDIGNSGGEESRVEEG